MAFLACVAVRMGRGVERWKCSHSKSPKLKMIYQWNFPHVSFVSIVFFFSCLICVTWCDYDVISMTIQCKSYKFTKTHLFTCLPKLIRNSLHWYSLRVLGQSLLYMKKNKNKKKQNNNNNKKKTVIKPVNWTSFGRIWALIRYQM